LQTIVAVAAEKNSTLVLPFPVELLRFLERAQQPVPTAPRPVPEPAPGPVQERLSSAAPHVEPDPGGSHSSQDGDTRTGPPVTGP
ncbi:slipin family protein, partial [Streptomyces viridosporus]